jgi:hypothetical protein
MAKVTKVKAVMKRSELGYTASSNYIPFELTDENGIIIRTLIMTRKDVNDLGWPVEVTVTIESGNKLREGTNG